MDWLLIALTGLLAGGLLALVFSRWPRASALAGAGGVIFAAGVGLGPALAVLGGSATLSLTLPWPVPGGSFAVTLDPLSAFFLLPVLLVSALAAIYGIEYLQPYEAQRPLGPQWFNYSLVVAGMVVVLVARNPVLFLGGWEVMSLAAFFLVTFEDEKPEVRMAGWTYLVATHLGTVFLLGLFILLPWQGGSAAPGMAGVLFVLSLLGFGAKAGLVPLHVWLPEAHPAAPSHVSALMSAVLIKMGIYGILRVLTFLGTPALWWGPLLMGIGLLGAVTGIAQALWQRDLKRALAYSSIENIGLIVLGLGVGLWGWALGQPVVAVLGLAGGLIHVWNHSLMKGLLFLGAGSVLHGTGTRDMEQMGGLMKRMPLTSTLMMLGLAALAALPPLNGFVSEWLIYLSLLRKGLGNTEALDGSGLAALLLVAVVALVGGLAAICFVRLGGVVLLGEPRSEAARTAHESGLAMTMPMLVLLALCIGIGLCPGLPLNAVVLPLGQLLGKSGQAVQESIAASGASLTTLGLVNLAIWVGIAAAAALLAWLRRDRELGFGPTWGCGYMAPTARMQYTGRSFAEFLAEHLLPRFLAPRIHATPPQGLFPKPGEFSSECPEPVREGIYVPFFRYWADRFVRLRWVQQGNIRFYMMYIILLVVLALAWVVFRTRGA